MIRHQSGSLVYLQFASLAGYQSIVHGVTTRVADPTLFPQGLNLSMMVAARPDDVVKARSEACSALGLRLDNLVVPRQVHGRHVAAVGEKDRGRGSRGRDNALPETDGMVTGDREVTLFVSAADCVPILLFDPIRQVIGAVHAGWRGTVANVAAEAVARMVECFGTDPGDVVAGIGPSIGPCCYSIGDEVAQAVAQAFGEDNSLITSSTGKERHFDLWRANSSSLVAAGLSPEKIETAGLCTACHPALFFSHRAEHGRAGRFAALIALK